MGTRALLKAVLVIFAAALTVSCGNGVKDANPTGKASVPLAVARPGALLGQKDVCPQIDSGVFRCLSRVVTETQGNVLRNTVPTGYGPADLVNAYNVPSGGGAGMVIGIVDAFDDPNAESELSTYHSQFGLPPCTSADGCFTKVNERGAPFPLPPEDFNWEVEIALDLQMASAVCPNCKILLVEGDSPSLEDLGTSVDTAVALGASVVSNSYGAREDPSFLTAEPHFNHPGVLITVSTGDFGTEVNYPATSQYTLAVGGTSLFPGSCGGSLEGGSQGVVGSSAGSAAGPALDQNGRAWCETAWSGAGSGCSQFFPKPSWENDPSCPTRSVSDVSAVADPFTGVAVFAQNQGGWIVVGGTSVASPVVASIFAETGRSTVDPSFVWQHTDDFYDITSGNNGFCSIFYECNAGPGYDGPTGWGTPDSALIGNAIRIDATATACSGNAATANVTVLGGSSGFDGDVTLSLSNVSPAPPEGSEITAVFSPNPVPAPISAGGTSAMQISTTPTTPSGTYTLTVQGSSPGVTQTTTMTLVVQQHAPGPITLVSPESGADGVGFNPTFTWTSSTDANSYALAIYSDSDCSGDALHAYTTSATSFTIPSVDALPVFATLSWQVTATNACAPDAVSTCSSFRTISCAGPRNLIANGGFEDGLAGWSVDAAFPPPVASGQRPHGGNRAAQLGTLDFSSAPFGDSAISQVLAIPRATGQTVSFWEWSQGSGFNFFDQQYVWVTPLDPSGPTVALMSELSSTQSYLERQFSLDPFAGQTVRLTFGVHQQGFGGSTGMFIDDVTTSVAQCGPPDFTVQIAPVSTEICAGASIDYSVSVTSVNGPNFTSPVTLSLSGLPSGVVASFADNPVAPGQTTTLTLRTIRPTVGGVFPFTLSGVAVTPPPAGGRTASASLTLDANTPQAPQVIGPVDGTVNVPLQPTLSWTAPFVPDIKAASIAKPLFFGASQYHLQIATDAAFTSIAVDTTLTDTTFTASSFVAATEYFWRVSAVNACGTSPWSSIASFIVGACAEGWSALTAIPDPGGGLQDGVAVAVPSVGKIYVIGGNERFSGAVNHTWAYDPSANAWAQKSDVPFPGVGITYGSAALVGGTIYVFGGNNPFGTSQALWKYDVARDIWTQGASLPNFDVGSAVAALGGKIYIAYGSGFGNQTWEYDPSTDGYTRKADAPPLPEEDQLHAVTLRGDIHVFGGGFHGSSHVVYTPATDHWTVAASMPFGVTNPAVGELGGKAIVAGGQPTAWAQIFDPATGSWTQTLAIAGEPNGIDSVMGATLNGRFHVIGGNDTSGPVFNHWQFHPCNLGNLSSATFLPFVVDGDGHAAGVSNERTTLFLANAFSGEPLTATCFLYGMNGAVLGRASLSAAAGEVHSVTDVVRVLKNASTVQNVSGSLAIFGTGLFEASASIVSNVTSDSAFEEGQSISGRLGGVLPAIEEGANATQVIFSNISPNTATLQMLAYPAQGGQTPAAATLTLLAGHNSVNYADVVQKLSLPKGFVGQLQFSSNQPIAAAARAVVPKRGYSGFEPVRSVADASSTIYVPYAEDSTAFSTSLLISNTTLTPADVTVTFVDDADTTGTTSGIASSRDLPLAPNADSSIPDVVRWALRQTSATPTGKHGFLVVTTPQAVMAQGKIVDNVTSDPAIPGLDAAVTSAFSPFLIRLEPITFIVSPGGSAAAPAATGGTSSTALSRFAVSNPGASTATVELSAISATGGPETQPVVVTLAPNAQLLTEDLVSRMGLPPIFLGSLVVRSDTPVLVYNHRRSGDTGDVIPIVQR